MALQLCLAVCGGTAFLGQKTVQAEVLYLALEDGPQRLHSRALRLADTAPSGLHLCHRAAPIGQGLERQIEAQLAEYPHIRPMVLEELCEELRQRPGRGGVGAGAAVVGGRELTRNTIKSNREASFTRDFPVVGSGGVPSIFTAKVWWCW